MSRVVRNNRLQQITRRPMRTIPPPRASTRRRCRRCQLEPMHSRARDRAVIDGSRETIGTIGGKVKGSRGEDKEVTCGIGVRMRMGAG